MKMVLCENAGDCSKWKAIVEDSRPETLEKEIKRLRAVVQGLEAYNTELANSCARLTNENKKLEGIEAALMNLRHKSIENTETIREIMDWQTFDFGRLCGVLKSISALKISAEKW